MDDFDEPTADDLAELELQQLNDGFESLGVFDPADELSFDDLRDRELQQAELDTDGYYRAFGAGWDEV